MLFTFIVVKIYGSKEQSKSTAEQLYFDIRLLIKYQGHSVLITKDESY